MEEVPISPEVTAGILCSSSVLLPAVGWEQFLQHLDLSRICTPVLPMFADA